MASLSIADAGIATGNPPPSPATASRRSRRQGMPELRALGNSIMYMLAREKSARNHLDSLVATIEPLQKDVLRMRESLLGLCMCDEDMETRRVLAFDAIRRTELQYRKITNTIDDIRVFNQVIEVTARRHKTTLREWQKGNLLPGATLAESLATASHIGKTFVALANRLRCEKGRLSLQKEHYMHIFDELYDLEEDFYGPSDD